MQLAIPSDGKNNTSTTAPCHNQLSKTSLRPFVSPQVHRFVLVAAIPSLFLRSSEMFTRPGKRLHNYGKSPLFLGKFTKEMVMFHSYVNVYQRVLCVYPFWPILFKFESHLWMVESQKLVKSPWIISYVPYQYPMSHAFFLWTPTWNQPPNPTQSTNPNFRHPRHRRHTVLIKEEILCRIPRIVLQRSLDKIIHHHTCAELLQIHHLQKASENARAINDVLWESTMLSMMYI